MARTLISNDVYWERKTEFKKKEPPKEEERRKWDGEGTIMRQVAEQSAKMMKNDEEKLRWDLLPLEAVEELVRVLTYGARKYKPNNWKKGNTFEDRERVFAAMMRHIASYRKGDTIDDESGLMALSHAFCNMMFLIYHELVLKQRRNMPDWD